MAAKDIKFHDQLLGGTPRFPLAEMFRYLLRTAEARIQVVTTNYDRLAEYAANRVQAYVSTGITAGWLQRFAPASVGAERPPAPGFEGSVTLLKVHGSLDWFRDAGAAVVGVPFVCDTCRHAAPCRHAWRVKVQGSPQGSVSICNECGG